MWHWTARPDLTGQQLAAIVGGSTSPDAGWSERPEERLAVVLTWGLMDQLRRPVPSSLACVDLYRQFVALTGVEPLGPLESVCVPATALQGPAG